eukprot:5508122-Heterocapsa_arctica.AAC.1
MDDGNRKRAKIGHDNSQEQLVGKQQHVEPAIESKVRNDISKIENNIANKKRCNDEQGAVRQTKLATDVE